MNTNRLFSNALKTLRTFGALGLVASSVAMAQPQIDPPSRVGRVADAAGEILLIHAGSPWQRVGRNHPVTNGDSMSVAADGRAEIEFGNGTLWLGAGSRVYFQTLDDFSLQVSLEVGHMVLRLRALDAIDGVLESTVVSVPRGGFAVLQPGFYRFAADPSGLGQAHVRQGELEVLNNAPGRIVLRAGQAAQIDGQTVQPLNITGTDSLDAYANARDQRYATQGRGYVASRMVGWRELDDYGTWRENPEYGAVWFPRTVAAGWAPYRFGRWTWVNPWGWTWIDDAPWGFAPSHYGRWVSLNGRWGWCPGRYEARPVYSPALVAWHGGDGFSASVNVNNPLLWWTPLAFNEVYYPSYYLSTGRWQSVNRPVVYNIAREPERRPAEYRYRNVNVPGGYTVVEQSVVAQARPVQTYVNRTIDVRQGQWQKPIAVREVVRPEPVREWREPSTIADTPNPGLMPPAVVMPKPNPAAPERTRMIREGREMRDQSANPAYVDPGRPTREGRSGYVAPSVPQPVQVQPPAEQRRVMPSAPAQPMQPSAPAPAQQNETRRAPERPAQQPAQPAQSTERRLPPSEISEPPRRP